MLLIFSDYAAEIGNVPGVTRPALIDLCVRQAKFRHAFVTAEEFRSFLGWSVEEEKCHSSSSHLQWAHLGTGSQHRRGRDQSTVGAAAASPALPSPWCFLLFPSDHRVPATMYCRPPPFLWTDLKPHFHFVLGTAFSVSCLCSLLTTKNISEGWKRGNKIIFSFFIPGK